MTHVITSILHWFFPDIPKHLTPKKYCSIILTVHASVFAFNYMYQYSKREIWKANTLKSSQLFGAIFYVQRAYSRNHKILSSWRFLSAVTFCCVCTWNIYWDRDSKRNNEIGNIQAHCGRRRKLYCAVTSIILTTTDWNHKWCIKRKHCNLPGIFINYW